MADCRKLVQSIINFCMHGWKAGGNTADMCNMWQWPSSSLLRWQNGCRIPLIKYVIVCKGYLHDLPEAMNFPIPTPDWRSHWHQLPLSSYCTCKQMCLWACVCVCSNVNSRAKCTSFGALDTTKVNRSSYEARKKW